MRQMSLAPQLRSHVRHYAEAHRTPVNRALHYAGIPLLLVSSLGLLSKAALPGRSRAPALRPNAAWAALLGAGLWYLRSDRKVGLLTLAGVTGCYALGSALPTRLLTALFGAGIAAHAVGHYGFEGKPPLALSSPVALLEAPAWLVAEWAGLDQ